MKKKVKRSKKRLKKSITRALDNAFGEGVTKKLLKSKKLIIDI